MSSSCAPARVRARVGGALRARVVRLWNKERRLYPMMGLSVVLLNARGVRVRGTAGPGSTVYQSCRLPRESQHSKRETHPAQCRNTEMPCIQSSADMQKRSYYYYY